MSQKPADRSPELSAAHAASGQASRPHPLLRVRASAGSGKTYTLTWHFLHLLASATPEATAGASACGVATAGASACGVATAGASACGLVTPAPHAWPEILAVTFTNRAAAEMRERIIRQLKLMALGQGTPPTGYAPWPPHMAAAWLDTILRRYGALNVRTIDSLLHLVVRLAALELDLPPDFEPIFGDSDALAPLLDHVLEQSRHDPDLYASLRDACAAVLAHTPHRGFMAGPTLRTRVLDLVFAVPGSADAGMAGPEAISARLSALCIRLRSTAAALAAAVQAEQLTLSKHAATALEKCQRDDDADLPPTSTMLRKPDLEGWLIKGGKDRASAALWHAWGNLSETVSVMDAHVPLLRGALRLMPYLPLARRVAEALPDYLRTQPRLPASRTPGLARQVLEQGYGVSAAFCRMGTRLTHLLIDEFQDTSREQWAALHPLVLEALSRGGSLTWVGDVKQAIYSWRGGDASLFEGVAHDPELLAVAGTPQTDTLPTNWRSRAAVVRANNSVFSQLAHPDTARGTLAVMLPADVPSSVLEAGTAQLIDGFTGAAQLESGKAGGYVQLERIAAGTRDELEEIVLERLTALIRARAQERPLGDMTVLVRSNSRATVVAGHLLAAGIAVVTENSLLLAEHPLIAQCVAFLEWLHAPHDVTALWTVLAGPRLLVPVPRPRADMEDWLVTRRRDIPLMTALAADLPDVWQLVAPFCRRGGLMTPYDVLREALDHWQVWSRLPAETPFLQRFLEILHGAEQTGMTAIGTFLEHWQQHGGEEKAPMPGHVDAVRIMTMHKAKGLQFPVVIVPWHDFTPRADADPVRVNLDGMDILTPRQSALGEAHYAALADIARETLNLLYVAWTRAEDELYGFLTQTTHSSRMPGLGRALDVLLEDLPATWHRQDDVLSIGRAPACLPVCLDSSSAGAHSPDPCSETKRPEASATPETSITSEIGTPEPKPTPLAITPSPDWHPMHWLPRLKIFHTAREDLPFGPRRRGSFVHACLEWLAEQLRADQLRADQLRANQLRPNGDMEDDIGDDIGNNTGNVSPALLEAAVAAARQSFALPVPDALLPDVTADLRWFLDLDDAPRWLRDGQPEQALLDADGNQYRPDLLVPPHAGTGWLVIEYKTGDPSPRHEQEHAAQLSHYLELLQRILPTGAGISGRIVYLDRRVLRVIESL